MTHIRTLTGLRGFAAFLVFISHSANDGYIPSIFGNGFGQIGVMLFFVLSGFLMAHLYVSRDFTRQSVINYSTARFARVVPLYLLALSLSFVISNYIYTDFFFDYRNIQDYFLALTFLKAKYTFWTIPVEVQFYIIFIGFWWLFSRSSSALTLTLAWLALFVVLALAARLLDLRDSAPILGFGFSFFVGVATAILMNRFDFRVVVRPYANWLGIICFILLFVTLPELRREYGLYILKDHYNMTWLDPLSWFIVYGLFISCAVNANSLQFLNWKPFEWLGLVSYGFYLLHRPIVYHAGELLGHSLPVFILCLVLVSALSFMSFHFFEKPLSSFIRKKWNLD